MCGARIWFYISITFASLNSNIFTDFLLSSLLLLFSAMLTKIKNSLQMPGGFSQDSKSTYATSNKESMVVGLQTLVQISSEATSKSNVVLKSALKKVNHHLPAAASATTFESCYLKSCFLCNKNLSLDKDIYMYRYLIFQFSDEMYLENTWYFSLVLWWDIDRDYFGFELIIGVIKGFVA